MFLQIFQTTGENFENIFRFGIIFLGIVILIMVLVYILISSKEE
jgi:hypothetical protein